MEPMQELGQNQENLQALAQKARADFDATLFWTIPRDERTAVEARNLGRQLAKHGGMRGLALADEIEKALLRAGESSWR